MLRTGAAFFIAAVVSAGPLQAAAPQSAKAVIDTSAKTMGVDTLSSIKLWGSGMTYSLGQNNNANQPWPQTPLNDYVRAIDFTQPTSRATAVTWAVAVTGGAAAQGAYQMNVPPSSTNWNQQLEIWTTPWGFLKGAAANNATLSSQTIGGRTYRVVSWNAPVKSPGGKPYRVVGYIGPGNLVERVDTWVENPIFGDMQVKTTFSDYRDNNGLKYPTTTVQERGGYPTFQAQILGVAANPADIRQLVAIPAGGPGGPPGGPGGAAGPTSEKLADGVYQLKGAYNALAVEFKDYVVLFEPGPQNEARALAVIAETKKLIPGKPIRYGVISHHHFDHTGGLAAVVGEGITIVTPTVNKAFLTNAMSGPRTLAPDSMSKSGRKPVIEAMTTDKKVFTDGTRTFEIHQIKGLPHADGLVVGWLPKEKILVYADMFNFPSPSQPVPNPPVVGTGIFLDNLERLKIEPEKILSVHTMNPDRLVTMQDIRASLGRK